MNSPKGALASCNMRVVAQHGGKLRHNSTKHGLFYCTDVDSNTTTHHGFVGFASDSANISTAAYQWQVTHVLQQASVQ